MARTDRRARLTGSDVLLAVLLLAGVGVSGLALMNVLEGFGWWFTLMLVTLVVLACAAGARLVTRHRVWGSLFAVVGAILLVTVLFASGEAFLGVIPTGDSIEALARLQQDGLQSIAAQSVPARADTGILLLIAIGAAGLTVALDFAAFSVRMPALAGAPLLVVALVPTFVVADLGDPMVLVLTAVVYLAILLVSAPRVPRRTAVGIGAAAVVAALIVPIVLPSVIPDRTPVGSGDRVATGLNPIITLGNDLRRADPSLALTYTTDATTGLYLRLTALDDFSGVEWAPDEQSELTAGIDAIGPVPGITPEVPVIDVTSEIVVANVLSRWLPVPYAAASIEGLEGEWGFDPDLLAVRSRDGNARGQEYLVTSVQVSPSVDQLLAAGTRVGEGLERYLELPDDLPAVVGSTAIEVVGTASTNYEKALALQDYFRSDAFTYSEEAPVENGYDGSGASVLEAFLAAKSGYCVHFSSAMAAMARGLDIPARIAVGFTPGERTTALDGVTTEYRVSTENFHAWPELWFADIGWVRFEPTPSRGETPAFAPSTEDDPATPEVDESVPPAPSSAPTPAPTSSSTPRPSLPPEDETGTPGALPGGDGASSVPWGTIVGVLALLLLATPAVLRLARRRTRLMAVEEGSAAQAWVELRDTAVDLGLRPAETLTPRQSAAELADLLDDDGAAALARLRDALERESFAGRPGEPVLADLRTVLWSLRRSAGLGRTLLAAVAPRSLVPRAAVVRA